MGEGDDGGPSWEEMTVGIVRATEGETLAQTRRQLEPNAMMEDMQKNAMLRKGEQARPEETTEAFKAAFAAVFKFRTDFAKRIVLLLADGAPAIETGFYEALTPALNKDRGTGSKLSVEAVKRLVPRQYCWAHFLRHVTEKPPYNQIPKTKKGAKVTGVPNEDVQREFLNDLKDLHYATSASTFKKVWPLFEQKWCGTPDTLVGATASSTPAEAGAEGAGATAGAAAAAAAPRAAAAAAGAGAGAGAGEGGRRRAAAGGEGGNIVARQRIAETVLAMKQEYGPNGRLGNWYVGIKRFMPYASSNQGQEKSFDILKGLSKKKRQRVVPALKSIFRNLHMQSSLRDPECPEFKKERRHYALAPNKTDEPGSKYKKVSTMRWLSCKRLRVESREKKPERIYCFDAKSQNVDMPPNVVVSDFTAVEVYVHDISGKDAAMGPKRAGAYWKMYAKSAYVDMDQYHEFRKSVECAVLVQTPNGLWSATCTCDDYLSRHYCTLTDMLQWRKVDAYFPTLNKPALSTRALQAERNHSRKGRDRREAQAPEQAGRGDLSPSPSPKKKSKRAAAGAATGPNIGALSSTMTTVVPGAGGIFSFNDDVTEDTDDNSVPRRAIEVEGGPCGKCGSTFTKADGEQVECRKEWETDTEAGCTDYICHGCWVLNGSRKEPVANHVNLAAAMMNLPRASQLKLLSRANAMTGTRSHQSATKEPSSTTSSKRGHR